MTDTRETVQEFFDNDEKLVQKWVETDPATWADLAGNHTTGELKAADMGFDFGREVGELSDKDLVEFRYLLIDGLHIADDRDVDKELSPIEHVTYGLLAVLEAELGGRWV